MAVACTQCKPFLSAVEKILAKYRSLPHVRTSVSPAQLFYSRPLRMPLDCIIDNATQLAPPKVRQRVEHVQEHSKKKAYQKRHAQPTVIKVGDFVRTLRPWKKHKLEAKWSAPKEVVHVNGSNLTFADGAKWNVRKCIPYFAPVPPDFTDVVDNNTARLAQSDHLVQPLADNVPLQQQATVAPTPPATLP